MNHGEPIHRLCRATMAAIMPVTRNTILEKTAEDFQAWLKEWVLQVPNRQEYMKKVGEKEKRQPLGVREHR